MTIWLTEASDSLVSSLMWAGFTFLRIQGAGTSVVAAVSYNCSNSHQQTHHYCQTNIHPFSKGNLGGETMQWVSTSMYCFVDILHNEARGNYSRTVIHKMFQSIHTTLNPFWNPNSFPRNLKLCCTNSSQILSEAIIQMKFGALIVPHLVVIYLTAMWVSLL